MAANLVIEEAYRVQKGDHGVLFGSQFEEGFVGRGIQREIRLPAGAPNKEFGNHLLNELRGPRGGPRKPDIVDLNDRTFYEIKPVRTFSWKREETIRQHVSLYRLADSIVREYNDGVRARTPPGSRALPIESEWRIANAQWKPPGCLTLPGLKGFYKLDTFATDYDSDQNCRGIIVYRVWKRVRNREEEQEFAAHVVVEDKDPKYEKLIPNTAALRDSIGRYDRDQPGLVIIVPEHIHDLLRKYPLIEMKPGVAIAAPDHASMQATLGQSTLSKLGSSVAHHPYLTAGAVIAVAATGGLIWYAGVGVAGGAEVISLAARRQIIQAAAQVAARGAAEVAKKAAAALIFFGVVKSARADEVTFSRFEALTVLPANFIAPYRSTYSALSNGMCIADAPESFTSSEKDVCVGDRVMYDSKPHAVAATLCAYPNNVCSEE